jgi:hypothetical protein
MRKFQKFFNDLTYINAELRRQRKPAKRLLGDSTNNNRILTVNQTIRLLRKLNNETTASKIQAAYEVLKPYIRVRKSKRTDAVDMTELVSTYRTLVMTKRKFRQTLGRRLA